MNSQRISRPKPRTTPMAASHSIIFKAGPQPIAMLVRNVVFWDRTEDVIWGAFRHIPLYGMYVVLISAGGSGSNLEPFGWLRTHRRRDSIEDTVF
jgi:hypothetical protein